MTSKEIGNWGEICAQKYLLENGYDIVMRNFTARCGEIDIIAGDYEGCTVFVEVKTRKSCSYGMPSEFVDAKKQEKIKRTAVLYLGTDDAYMRFDVIEVLYGIKNGIMILDNINHIINAF